MSYDRLLIWQFKGKPRAVEHAKLIDDEIRRAWEGIAALPEALDIDNARGVNLDLVGKHVGQARVLTGIVPRDYFGFFGNGGGGFRVQGAGGSKFYRLGDPLNGSVELDDDDYRFLIRCRIAKNFMVGTIPEMMDALDFIFDGYADVSDNFDMSISIVIGISALSDILIYAIRNLDVLPRPAGVGVSLYFTVTDRPFGFAGSPGTFGFGDGAFARILR
ncbi:DUF2612 domain-containing protein [Burkholderia anthina]|uniref:DUF2612 domain-containing protein n=1 Tax=Burkholderia anthina TaxID=179879 RepID=UPI00158A5E92|nr:DUF2612 domain-containing protein [Burkholderia anthina]